MRFFNAKEVKPTKSRHYLTAEKCHHDDDEIDLHFDYIFYAVLQYNAEVGGWNVSEHSRDYEMFPDYWAELPTLEEMEGGSDV